MKTALRSLLILLGIVFNTFPAMSVAESFEQKPLALVYSGKGICEGCDTSLSLAFRQAGFRTEGVRPGNITQANLERAAVFAVPGGDQELDVMLALFPGEAQNIKQYVTSGGHYLGVCLGSFLAAPLIINTPSPTSTLPSGLDLFKGRVFNHSETKEARIEPILWRPGTPNSSIRMMYFQDGPHFTLNDPRAVIWAQYQDGSIAAFQAPLGRGRVGLLGPHPEADETWWNEDPGHPLYDPDGKDTDLFIEFMDALIGN